MGKIVAVSFTDDYRKSQGITEVIPDDALVLMALSWGVISVELCLTAETVKLVADLPISEVLAMGERIDHHPDVKLKKKRGPRDQEKARLLRGFRKWCDEKGYAYLTDGGNYSYRKEWRDEYQAETGISVPGH